MTKPIILAAALAALAASAQAEAEPSGVDIVKSQAEANSKPGPRHAPAKTIEVPPGLEPGMAAAVAAPYSHLWNLDGGDAAGWRAIVQRLDGNAIKMLPAIRQQLGVSIEERRVGGIRAYLLKPANIPPEHRGQLIVHFHGGGFVFGNGEAGTYEATLLAGHGGYEVLSIDYRMLPDHPFPAGIDDAIAMWKALVKTREPATIAIHGTSAGANIALAFLLRAKQEGLPMPAALGLGSPPTDFTDQGDSKRTNEWLDNILVSPNGGYLRYIRETYARGGSADPLISPLFGDMKGMPPTVLITGTRDLLLSDTVRLHRKLRQAGVDADLHVYEAGSHSFFLLAPMSDTAKDMYREVTGFFATRLRHQETSR